MKEVKRHGLLNVHHVGGENMFFTFIKQLCRATQALEIRNNKSSSMWQSGFCVYLLKKYLIVI